MNDRADQLSVSLRASGEPFLVLPENRFAQTAVERLLRRKGRGSGLVYLCGPSGVGKSHLVRQFVQEARQAEPPPRIVHLTASEFAARLAEASDAGTLDRFRQQHREIDLLVCEDLHAVENRPETQRQLVAVLDDVLHAGGRVLLTCRRLPGELIGVLPRLVNRCHGGTCVSISSPDATSRASLIAHFASRRQIPLSNDVTELLAAGLPVSPRELLAAVVQLEACARLERCRIDAAFTRRYLAGEVRPPDVTLPQIARTVARQFGVKVGDLRRPDRTHGLVLPRQCAMLLARELTGQSLERIAAYFGRRNHSTVVHACHRLRQLLADDPSVRQHLFHIRQSLGLG